MEGKGRIEVVKTEESRSCNCCARSNYKDGATIYEIGIYNRLNQGTCLVLCDTCLNELTMQIEARDYF